MVQGATLAAETGRLVDESIETLRWCRQHLGERRAAAKLRELEITLAALALEIDYEMDGQTDKALDALQRADSQARFRLPAHPGFIGPDPFECG